jgi:hypothetical protein
VDIASGAPLSSVTDVAVEYLLAYPSLQLAVGTAIGRGVGALFVDKLLGSVRGEVTGAVATVSIVAAAGMANLIIAVVGPAPRAASAEDSPWYLVQSVVPDSQGAAALDNIARASATDGGLVLTGLAVTSASVDLQLIAHPAGTPQLVEFRLPLNRLIGLPTERTVFV